MELRRRREGGSRDLRPTSLLVAPNLTLPRREILRDFRIEWVEGTAESFAADVLSELARESARGFAFIGQYLESSKTEVIPLVSHLASEHPSLHTEYLLGEEPQWADLITGRAIERSHDKVLFDVATEILGGKRKNTCLAVTGTAGTGKSTALMGLALRLSGNGIPVLWLDKDSEVSIARIRKKVRSADGKIVLAIDDADLYGPELIGLLRDLVPSSQEFLFVFGIRSGKVDEITSVLEASGDVQVYEHVVPPLTDDDIDSLIGTLERSNRLGILAGEGPEARRRAFRDQAGRQMLVAMIQATSSEKLEQKAHDELTQLQDIQKYIYSLVCVASSLRNSLPKDEILLACSDRSDDGLSALDRLTARHLISERLPAYWYRARHRVIADLVFDKLRELRELKDVLFGLAWALASKANPSLERHSRIFKFLASVTNHAFLRQVIGVMDARDVYRELETILSWNYHYWLQRGSLEVEAGDIKLADTFLSTAHSLGSGDYRVRTAYAYMLMRKAYETPADLHAQELLNEGIEILEDVIEAWGSVSAYPFHVMGSQGLAWIHRAPLTPAEKRTFLSGLGDALEKGVRLHPRKLDLIRLRDDIRKEILLTVAVPSPPDH